MYCFILSAILHLCSGMASWRCGLTSLNQTTLNTTQEQDLTIIGDVLLCDTVLVLFTIQVHVLSVYNLPYNASTLIYYIVQTVCCNQILPIFIILCYIIFIIQCIRIMNVQVGLIFHTSKCNHYENAHIYNLNTIYKNE